jgi:TonB family protein
MNRYIGKCLLSFGVLLVIVFASRFIEGQVVPVSFSEIITALKATLPAGTTRNQLIMFLIADVNKRKVDERLIVQDEDKLRQAGATEALIAAIRQNLVLPEIMSDSIISRFPEGNPPVLASPDGTQRIGLLFDKFESVSDRDLSARLDNLYTQLNNDPTTTSAIIIYGADIEMNRRFAKIRNAINFRKYDPARIRFLRGDARATILTAIYIVPGASEKQLPDPVPSPTPSTPTPVPTPTPEPKKVEALKILSEPRPNYTAEARQKGVQGTVILKVTFLDSGLIGPIEVISGLENGLTDKAIAAAKEIKFIPESIAGKPISVTRRLQYFFSLY